MPWRPSSPPSTAAAASRRSTRHSGSRREPRLTIAGRNADVSATTASTSTRTCSSSRAGSASANAPPVAKPGVVDEDLDVEPERLDAAREPVSRSRLRQVATERLGPHAVLLAQLVRELVEPGFAPRDEEHAVAAPGQLAGDLGADSRRGAGDQCRSAAARLREAHGHRSVSILPPNGGNAWRPCIRSVSPA